MSSYGFIYVMQSPHMPGLYKVGMTTRAPHERAKELSQSTSCPSPFEVLYYAEVCDPTLVERELFETLCDFRVSQGREFFSTQLYRIIDEIQLYAHEGACWFSASCRKQLNLPLPPESYAPCEDYAKNHLRLEVVK